MGTDRDVGRWESSGAQFGLLSRVILTTLVVAFNFAGVCAIIAACVTSPNNPALVGDGMLLLAGADLGLMALLTSPLLPQVLRDLWTPNYAWTKQKRRRALTSQLHQGAREPLSWDSLRQYKDSPGLLRRWL